MRWIINKIAGIGEHLITLSPRSRMQIVVVGLMLLGGGAIYKLIVSIKKLQEPLPVATPAQLIKPMEGLLRQTSSNLSNYRTERNRNLKKLDSLKFFYNPKKSNDR